MVDKYYSECMVDIETTGLFPDRSAMIQLAAVRFDLETKEVDTRFFYRALKMPPWRFWQESTWDWWSDKPEILTDIVSRMEDPAVVMQDFFNWSVAQDGPAPRFWSKPLSFDFPFVSSYFRDFGLSMPYNYSQAMDMRSFMRGRLGLKQFKEPKPEFVGNAHNALSDTIHQIKVLFEHEETLNDR